MKKIYESLTDLIGNTPLLRLSHYESGLQAELIAKLEYFNPGGSVKDRIGLAMIEEAEKQGLLTKNSVIIEPTSGNTGIALSCVAAVKGYQVIIVLPETFSHERRKLLTALGAQLVLTPGSEGMPGAIRKAGELAQSIPGSFIPQQFRNPANPEIHRKTTAEEIWRDTEGEIDFFVGGVGTGGTITGVGEALKKKKPDIKIIAVEPFDSPILSSGKSGVHKLQGLAPSFIPDIYNPGVVDEIISVKTEEAYEASKLLAKKEGLLVGISSGAAAFAASRVAAREENKGKTVVVLLPDTGERYLSTPMYEG
ncbi:cysteine synthase A [Anaerocolumna chitinilytica]|uniref:Cysteine synthase n=1 Tax=Anaerocolumna chitinilytica TaxID=1727145 RepID=A0A7I8DKD8_9FIRM|nr:cysteine synthase A [Anaerocolumna chitinilytica]BCJ98913.1 cysteine synthase A [Anaerocolumna chitinilytica]